MTLTRQSGGTERESADAAPIPRPAVDRIARRSYLISLVIILTITTLVVAARFVTQYPYRPEDLIRQDTPIRADAIVVLEGGGDARIDHAMRLVARGYSDTILYPGLTRPSSARLAQTAATLDIEYELVSGNGAGSTFTEAISARELLRVQRGISSILLVTSDYHSHRALWIFRRLLPRRISILSTPTQEDWWSTEGAMREGSTAQDVFRLEQRKFVGYFFLYGVLPVLTRNRP